MLKFYRINVNVKIRINEPQTAKKSAHREDKKSRGRTGMRRKATRRRSGESPREAGELKVRQRAAGREASLGELDHVTNNTVQGSDLTARGCERPPLVAGRLPIVGSCGGFGYLPCSLEPPAGKHSCAGPARPVPDITYSSTSASGGLPDLPGWSR